jgi:hypothetical protein
VLRSGMVSNPGNAPDDICATHRRWPRHRNVRGNADSERVGEPRLGLRIVVLGQTFDLLDVEHCVALEEMDLAIDLLPFGVFFSSSVRVKVLA